MSIWNCRITANIWSILVQRQIMIRGRMTDVIIAYGVLRTSLGGWLIYLPFWNMLCCSLCSFSCRSPLRHGNVGVTWESPQTQHRGGAARCVDRRPPRSSAVPTGRTLLSSTVMHIRKTACPYTPGTTLQVFAARSQTLPGDLIHSCMLSCSQQTRLKSTTISTQVVLPCVQMIYYNGGSQKVASKVLQGLC